MRSAAPASIQVSLILRLSGSGSRGDPSRHGPRRVRQLAPHEIGWILELPRQRRDDLAVGRDRAWIGYRAIGLDGLMQLRQGVVGNRWEDVMLDVIVHVPVEEPEDR